MNNKDFIIQFSHKINTTPKESQIVVQNLVSAFVQLLEENNELKIDNFANFKIIKEKEKIVMKPDKKNRLLLPPRLSILFSEIK